MRLFGRRLRARWLAIPTLLLMTFAHALPAAHVPKALADDSALCILYNESVNLCIVGLSSDASTDPVPDNTPVNLSATSNPDTIPNGGEIAIYLNDGALPIKVCTSSPCSVGFAGGSETTLNLYAKVQTPDGLIESAGLHLSVTWHTAPAQTIAFGSTTPASPTMGSGSFTVAATGGASGNAVTFSTSSPACSATSVTNVDATYTETFNILGVGTCTVHADQGAGAGYAAASEASEDVHIGQGSQSIAFGGTKPTPAYSVGGTFQVTANGTTSGNVVSLSVAGASSTVCSLSADTPAANTDTETFTILTAGTCTVHADQGAGAGYAAATEASEDVSIGQASQTITFTGPTNYALSDSPVSVSATADSSLTVSFASQTPLVCSATAASVTLLTAGTCTIRASQPGNSAYAAATPVDRSFTITAPPAPTSPPAPPAPPASAVFASPTVAATQVATAVPSLAPTQVVTDVPTVAPATSPDVATTPVVQETPASAPGSPTEAAGGTSLPGPTTVPSATDGPRPTSAYVVTNGAHFTIGVNQGTIVLGQAITLTATLSSLTGQPASLIMPGAADLAGSRAQSRQASMSHGALATSNSVTFTDGDRPLGTADLVDGTATLVVATLGSGVHNITATLHGTQATASVTTPAVVVIAQKADTIIPLLALRNFNHTVVGGRAAACTLKQNTSSRMQRGCELVSSDWLPGARVTYTVSYTVGKNLVVTVNADGQGHAQSVFNVACLPAAVKHGLAREVALISARAFSNTVLVNQ